MKRRMKKAREQDALGDDMEILTTTPDIILGGPTGSDDSSTTAYVDDVVDDFSSCVSDHEVADPADLADFPDSPDVPFPGACPLTCGPCGVGAPGKVCESWFCDCSPINPEPEYLELFMAEAQEAPTCAAEKAGLVRGPDITLDSGAAISVADPDTYPGCKVVPSAGSKSG